MPEIADDPKDQSEVIEFLKSGAGVHPGAKTEIVQTHAAIIFLIGDNAYKIKRGVKYSYLDFSTVDLRGDMLRRELELNQPAAPGIYRDVVPITRETNGNLKLNGTGTAIEWVMRMARFPEEAELHVFAKTNAIPDAMAEALGKSIAKYHDRSSITPLDGGHLISEIVDELNLELGEFRQEFSKGELESYLVAARKSLDRHGPAMSKRTRDGYVRRCHGDLHLRNIVVIDGTPTPFDALEFDERLGTCDILYDLAFLLMDLDKRGFQQQANRVLNSYVEEQSDMAGLKGLALLPIYLSIRAAIRCMVDFQTAKFAHQPEPLENEARKYLNLASKYLDPTSPRLVAIGGLSGTGKSTIAKKIAHQIGTSPGAIHLRSDVERKRIFNAEPLTHLQPEAYSPAVSSLVYENLRNQAATILATGHSVIVDAVHSDPESRRAIQDIAEHCGAGFSGIWLETDVATCVRRVQARVDDPSDADAAVVTSQAEKDTGNIGWVRVDCAGSPAEVSKLVIESFS